MCGRACRRIAALTLALSVLLAAGAGAGLDEWTSNGPFGGSVAALAIDPQIPTTLYAGTAGAGVFRSTDGGDHWDAMNEGLGLTVGSETTGIYVESLAIDPQTPTTLYVGTSGGAFKSTDAGAHWRPIDYAPLAIDPQTPSTLYAAPEKGVMRSLDGGDSWSAVNEGLVHPFGGLPEVLALAIDPQAPGTVYAATRVSRVFKSTDGGDWWHAANDGLPAGPEGIARSFSSLAIDPQTPTTLYAGTTGQIFKSVDGGAHWSAVARLPHLREVVSLAIDPRTPATLYAGTDETVFPDLRGGRLLKSTDGGVSWHRLPNDRPVHALAIDPEDPAIVYAGTIGDGVIRSTDAGGRWSAVNTGIANVNVVSLAIDPRTPTTVYAGTGTNGVFRSADAGRHWRPVNDGLDFVEAPVALAIDPQIPTTVYAGTRHFLGGGVYRSFDGGADWSALDGFPSLIEAEAVVIDPRTPTTLYVGGRFKEDINDRGELVYRSTDGGDHWTVASDGLPGFLLDSLAIDPRTPTTLYAGLTNGEVYKSVDGGGRWNAVSDGLPLFGSLTSLAIDPRTPTTLYAGSRRSGVFKSVDGGGRWRAVNDGLSNLIVEAVAIDPLAPATLYAGTRNGIFKSTDGGDHWSAIHDGLPNTTVFSLAIDPATPSTLYAGTRSGGVFEIQQVSGLEVLSLDGRFTAEVEWRDARGATGAGKVVVVRDEASAELRSRDSAVARFFSADNWELLVKVLDGRAHNGRFWVYLAAATDVELTTTVTDTSCGHVQTYRNPPGRAAPAVTDTAAFRGCAAPAPPSCAPGPTTFCLGDGGRFRVETAWRDFTGGSGSGRGVSLPRAGLAQSRDSGLFYFFSPDNWELLVKVLDGCGINDHYWVFAAATTDVEYRLRVTDTQSGDIKEYTNPLGNAAAAVTDTGAFARCP